MKVVTLQLLEDALEGSRQQNEQMQKIRQVVSMMMGVLQEPANGPEDVSLEIDIRGLEGGSWYFERTRGPLGDFAVLRDYSLLIVVSKKKYSMTGKQLNTLPLDIVRPVYESLPDLVSFVGKTYPAVIGNFVRLAEFKR